MPIVFPSKANATADPPPSTRPPCPCLLAAVDARQEEELVGAAGDPHPGAVRDLAGQDLVGQRVLHLALDDALQRPRAVDRVVALVGQPGARRLVEVERDLAILEQLLQPRELDVDDLRHVAPLQAVEQDDVVEPVEELRPEMGAAPRP